MTLSYHELMSDKRKKIRAKITTDHPASSYGIPVVVLADGSALDYGSAAILDYQVEKATPRELELLERWRMGMPPLA